MNKITLSLLLLSILLYSNTANAKTTVYGIGTAVDSKATIYIPIDTQSFLIEPSFSILTSNRKPDSNSISSARNRKIYRLGLGLFKKSTLTSTTTAYYGARIGYDMDTQKTSNSGSSSKFEISELYIAPTFGVEYFLSLKFSMSMNMSAKYTMGNEIDTDNSGSYSEKTTNLTTSTKIIFKYHF